MHLIFRHDKEYLRGNMNLQEKFAYMKTGKPYNDLDPLLEKAREESTKKTDAINNESDPQKKEQLIRELFGSAGKNPFANPNFRCEFGQNIHVGDDFYANYDCTLLDDAPITIGDHVLLAPKVGLFTSNHLFDPIEREKEGCIARPIVIGNHV